MLDLESAIKHCEEVAEEMENGSGKGCLRCAAEHRQLAEWLRELKAYKTGSICQNHTRRIHDKP